MTTELKAKDCACAYCGNPADTIGNFAWCQHPDCPIVNIRFKLSQWNTRPRESVLEAVLAQAREALNFKRGDPVSKLDKAIAAINSVLGKGGE